VSRCLVTGGCGFIGGHIVDKLVSLGHEVVVVDNYSAECNDNFHHNPKADYNDVDINDYHNLLPCFQDVEYVFHLAAQARIMVCMQSPRDCGQTNFMGTYNVLEASRTSQVKRVMYSSTSSAYGLRNDPPLKEDMPRDCLNPYSVTKVAAEDLCKMYYGLWGLETVVFRYFNVYGERQPTKGQYAPVIGLFQKQKAAGELMTVVGDGGQKRDYTHVLDVAEINLKAAFTDNTEVLGEIINVGTGRNHSVLDVVNLIGGDYELIPERPGEARETLADITKLKSLLGYEPQVKLEDWIKENE
jgi:UDP-glucose 4-epimerase